MQTQNPINLHMFLVFGLQQLLIRRIEEIFARQGGGSCGGAKFPNIGRFCSKVWEKVSRRFQTLEKPLRKFPTIATTLRFVAVALRQPLSLWSGGKSGFGQDGGEFVAADAADDVGFARGFQ
jgi:hypothetical protein